MHPLARTAAVAVLLAAGTAGPLPEPVPALPGPVAAPVHVPPPVSVPRAQPVGEPTRVRISAIAVDERLDAVGLQSDGAMQTPTFGRAGWYAPGPRPGAPGPAVLVAHVHGPAGDDVFARLHELRPGDRVTVERTDGRSVFVVTGVEQAPKDKLPYDRIWSDDGDPVLRLITCGGQPDPDTRTYPDNTIVYARLDR